MEIIWSQYYAWYWSCDHLINVRRLLHYFGCPFVVVSVFVVFWCRDLTTAESQCAIGLSAVCDCGIS